MGLLQLVSHLVGASDIAWGTSSFSWVDENGVARIGSHVNASHIPMGDGTGSVEVNWLTGLDPGHKHSVLWSSDGVLNPWVVDANGRTTNSLADVSVNARKTLNKNTVTFSPASNETQADANISLALTGQINIPITSTHTISDLIAVYGEAINYGDGDIRNMSGCVSWVYNVKEVAIDKMTATAGFVGSINGTVDTIIGVETGMYLWGATVQDMFGIRVLFDCDNSTIVNRYGLFIGPGVGDIVTPTNDYGIYVADAAQRNYFAGKLGIGTTAGNSNLSVVGLVAYPNNVAAIAAGLAVGDFYRNAANTDCVCVVH